MRLKARTPVSALVTVALGLGACGRVAKCPRYPEGENCTHITVSPERLARAQEAQQSLLITFLEHSIPDELAKTPYIAAYLDQGTQSIPLEVTDIAGATVTVAPPGAAVEELKAGSAAKLRIEFDNGYGKRSATAPITLFNPVRFGTDVETIALPKDEITLRDLKLLPTSAIAPTAARLAVQSRFAKAKDDVEADRICYLNLDGLRLLSNLAKDPATPEATNVCPISGFRSRFAISRLGCEIGLFPTVTLPMQLYLHQPASPSCSEMKDPRSSSDRFFSMDAQLVGDTDSDLLAVIDPSRWQSTISVVSSRDFVRLSVDLPVNFPVLKLAFGSTQTMMAGRPSVDFITLDESLNANIFRKVGSFYAADAGASRELTEQYDVGLPKTRERPGRFLALIPIHLQLTDLDQDGLQDLVLISKHPLEEVLSVYFSQGLGDGRFSKPNLLPIPVAIDRSFSSARVLIADMDGNSTPDLVLADTAGNRLAIVFNKSRSR